MEKEKTIDESLILTNEYLLFEVVVVVGVKVLFIPQDGLLLPTEERA